MSAHESDKMSQTTQQMPEGQGSKESAPASSKASTAAQQRRNRKRQTDRVAQQQHRKRQKQYVIELEEKLKILQSNDQSEVVQLGMQNFRLQKELESFHALYDDMARVMKRYQDLMQNSILPELAPTTAQTGTSPNAGGTESAEASDFVHAACEETINDGDCAMLNTPTQQPVAPGASSDQTGPNMLESEKSSERENDTAVGTEWSALDDFSGFDFDVDDALQPPIDLDQATSEESSEDWTLGMGNLPGSFSGAMNTNFIPSDADSTVTSRYQGKAMCRELPDARERPHKRVLGKYDDNIGHSRVLNTPQRLHNSLSGSGIGVSGNAGPTKANMCIGQEKEQSHFNFENFYLPNHHGGMAFSNQLDDNMLHFLPSMLLDPLGSNFQSEATSAPFLLYPPLQEDKCIYSIIERARNSGRSIEPPHLLEFLLDNPRNTLSMDLKSYLEPVRRTKRTSEFLATYWVLYLLLRWYIVGDEESYQSLPSWLRPTQLQRTIKHPVAISLIAWPGLREEIVRVSQFSESGIHDVLTDIGKHLSVCIESSDLNSNNGNSRIAAQITNLANWKLDDAFFDSYPSWKGIAT